MTTAKAVTAHQRGNFKKIMGQLDRTKAESKIVKIIGQAQAFLDEHDIAWDAISLHMGTNYIPVSERVRRSRAAKLANGHAPVTSLGRERRELLKRAIVQHKDWETVRDTLSIDMSHARVADLLAVAELLEIDPKFVKLFEGLPEEPVTPPSNNTQEKK
jgi:hypothetical protein